ncbi:AbrB/MazE/SpoVT family DNA-binding domain-containing protein [Sphingomonas sp. PB4P5]|uniref:AbrB/MazE/SpoVT family DNA-binding domain-containing protein n=1 Tax=Parasphingomonas puruogangriensis TaxID=3096155 RepID=UPI002FCBF338
MQTSRITSKHQATVPADVRAALGVGAGDTLAWEVRSGAVSVRKARTLDVAFAAATAATLDEWDSAEDDEAWRDL